MKVNKLIIKWEYVFLIKEIKDYLSINDLIEVSLLSKLLRLKLKPLLFRCIQLNHQNLSKHSNYFANRKNKWPVNNESIFGRLLAYSKRLVDSNGKIIASKIDPFVKEIQVELGVYHPYLKEFKIIGVGKPCFYIFPITKSFTGLVKLQLTDIHINLLHFAQVTEVLVNLQELELDNVNFIKSKDSSLENDLGFPRSLTKLKYLKCYIGITDLPRNFNEFIFNQLPGFFKYEFEPQPKSLKKLKILEFSYDFRPPVFNNNWIKLNPQLLELRVCTPNFDQINLDLIANSNILQCLCIKLIPFQTPNSLFNFPILNSIKNLYLSNFSNFQYSTIEKICKSFKNLEVLNLKYIEFDENVIIELDTKLPNLKVLSLVFTFKTYSIVKLPPLVHIKRLYLDFRSNIVEEFILPPPSKSNLIIIKNNGRKFIG